MKVLLDENLPDDLRHFLAEHDARTAAYMGWSGLENGELLAKAAEAGFDGTPASAAAFGCSGLDRPAARPSNAMEDLLPLVADLIKTLDVLQPKSVVRLG